MVRIGTPWRHPESGIFWFRKRVPKPLRARLGRSEIKFSLRTRDPALARVRNLEMLSEIERSWAGIGVDRSEQFAQPDLLLVGRPKIAPVAATYPPQPLEETTPAAAVKLRPLFESYAEEAALAPSTIKRWTVVIDRFEGYLGHDDAARVARSDVVAFKDSLVKLMSNITVRDVYVAALKAMFQYGVDQGMLAANPAASVKVRVKKALIEREKGFDHQEARAILAATLRPASNKISAEMAGARRWVPWLCAYTGARVNEITCLSGRDVVRRNGIAMIRIRAETNKTRKWREVPLHPDVIEQGFLIHVQMRGSKPLFYDPDRSRGGKAGSPHYKKVGERLAEWVRSLNVDPRVAPNHGWRHRFSSVARYVGMPEDIRNYIQGHAGPRIADRYGDTWPEVAYREIKKIPAYQVVRSG